MVSVASRSVPGRFYEVADGRCNCTAASFGRECRHVAQARQMADAEEAIGARYREMTQLQDGPMAHKTIHEALAAIYREVGYVQKLGKVDSFGAKYTYAGEADLIAAVRPSMVDHEVYMHVAQVLNREHESFTNARGTLMHHVRLDLVVRFTHGPSGTSVDCMASGEGIDSGDKATPKALTGAYKYAIRETFCIETGDDPDGTPSSEQERTAAHLNGSASPVKTPSNRPKPTWQAELLGALNEHGLTMNDLRDVLNVESVTPGNYRDLIDGWLFDNPDKSVRILVRLAAPLEPVGAN